MHSSRTVFQTPSGQNPPLSQIASCNLTVGSAVLTCGTLDERFGTKVRNNPDSEDKKFHRKAFGLRYLILVMGKNEVDSPRVEVDRVAKKPPRYRPDAPSPARFPKKRLRLQVCKPISRRVNVKFNDTLHGGGGIKNERTLYSAT